MKVDKEVIIKMYLSGKSIKKISEELGNCRRTITKILKDNNIQQHEVQFFSRKYRIRENWLDNIDSEIKVYFLGLMAADGCIMDSKNDIHISLKKEDEYILKKLSEEIYIDDRKLSYETRETSFGPTSSARLQICNKKLRDRCIELGLTPRKTFTLKFIKEIPDQLIHHFIRGYFDGDGCIYVSPQGKSSSSTSILGTRVFLEDIKKQILNSTTINYIKIRAKSICSTGNYLYELRIAGKQNSILFKNYIYKNATFFLTRKKNKFDSIKVIKPQKVRKYHVRTN